MGRNICGVPRVGLDQYNQKPRICLFCGESHLGEDCLEKKVLNAMVVKAKAITSGKRERRCTLLNLLAEAIGITNTSCKRCNKKSNSKEKLDIASIGILKLLNAMIGGLKVLV